MTRTKDLLEAFAVFSNPAYDNSDMKIAKVKEYRVKI